MEAVIVEVVSNLAGSIIIYASHHTSGLIIVPLTMKAIAPETLGDLETIMPTYSDKPLILNLH